MVVKAGASVEAERFDNSWYQAKIREVDGDRCLLTFPGLGIKWDEWISIEKVRPVASPEGEAIGPRRDWDVDEGEGVPRRVRAQRTARLTLDTSVINSDANKEDWGSSRMISRTNDRIGDLEHETERLRRDLEAEHRNRSGLEMAVDRIAAEQTEQTRQLAKRVAEAENFSAQVADDLEEFRQPVSPPPPSPACRAGETAT
jgi:hypothetical protein